MGRLWGDYREQKNDLGQLLAKAEEELQRSLRVIDASQLANELRMRHEAHIQLRETTEELLRRMKSTLEELTSGLRAEQRYKTQY